MKGGMHFYRGSGAGAARYFEEGHGRAEAYYTEGHQAAVQVDTWRGGERLSSAVLEGRGELESWVEGRDPATGEVKGLIRPGARSGRRCASWRWWSTTRRACRWWPPRTRWWRRPWSG